jgi:RNA polymerase sigma-70 factor (ECF subfamily)
MAGGISIHKRAKSPGFPGDEQDDESTVSRAQQATSRGDPVTHIDAEKLRQLIDAHGAALTLFASQWCRVPDDALQDALIDLLRQSPAPNYPVAWLYKTVRRRATNLARAEQRRAKHQRRAGEQRKPWFLPPDNVWDDTVDLESLLTKLPRLEREIVVARVWGELSFGQIADLVNRSTSSVHRRYQRALVQLGQMMNKQHENPRQRNDPRPCIT